MASDDKAFHCPKCGTHIPTDSDYCPKCGAFAAPTGRTNPPSAPAQSTCPRCSATSPPGTKFCSSCGGSLGPVTCERCNTTQRSGARFCDSCGAPIAAGAEAARPGAVPLMRNAGPQAANNMPWGLIGVLGAAMVVVIAFAVTRTGLNPAPPQQALPAGQGGAPLATTDISNLTPRQSADRLYNRVMRARAAGDSGEVTFFAPMGVAAYEMMGELDLDARYHVGMIHHAAGDYEAALEQADSMEAEVPGHLLALAIRYEVARSQNDSGAMQQHLSDFQANYEAQQASNRSEYLDHANTISSMLEAGS